MGCVCPGRSAQRGCLPSGCLSRGVYTPCTQKQTPQLHARIHPPWTEWLTDRCKNITFPQLRLLAVIKVVFWLKEMSLHYFFMYWIIKRLHTFACARAALTSRLSGSPRDASVSFLYFLVNLYRFWMHTWNVTAINCKNILLKVCFATTEVYKIWMQLVVLSLSTNLLNEFFYFDNQKLKLNSLCGLWIPPGRSLSCLW